MSIFHTYLNDVPKPWGMYFQDSASPIEEGIVELHDTIMFYMIVILVVVTWALTSIIRNYNEHTNPMSYKYLTHGTTLEIIWTIIPGVILLFIAFPSFALLYLCDEVVDPAMTVKVIGNQWYWQYEYSDFINKTGDSIAFDSYIIPVDMLEPGQLRMLDVDNRLIIPVDTHVRFIVTAADVIHDFCCPSLGIKIDANPGRLNQVSTIAQREGVFYGGCSEICGVKHDSMPIAIQAVSLENFLEWLDEQS